MAAGSVSIKIRQCHSLYQGICMIPSYLQAVVTTGRPCPLQVLITMIDADKRAWACASVFQIADLVCSHQTLTNLITHVIHPLGSRNVQANSTASVS